MTGVNGVTETELAGRALWRFTVTRSLRLVDLTGPGLAKLGADARLCMGDHAVARRWGLALWRHPVVPDGLAYRARHDPDRVSIAIFDRVAEAIEADPLGSLLQQPALLARILHHHGFGLFPD